MAEIEAQATWFRSHGGECSAVHVGASQFGRALFASRPIYAGERILEIPEKLVLNGNKLPQKVLSLLQTQYDWSPLALLLLAEKHKGADSFWAPYISCLPSPKDLHSTIFWSDEELACLECTRVARGTLERREMLIEEFSAVSEIMEACPWVFGANVSFKNFMHSYATVVSRAWNGSCPEKVAMRPLVDFCNHNPSYKTMISFDSDKDATIIAADRDYEKGDQVSDLKNDTSITLRQVYISYGHRSNAVLAVDYGFAISANPFDQAEMWMSIPMEDPLRKAKLELLREHNMPTLEDSDGCESGELPVIIEKVEGWEMLTQARSFARLICVDSSEDLKELVQESTVTKSPLAYLPRQNMLKEARAMNFLLGMVEGKLLQHEKTLLDLETSSMEPVRLQMATAILHGEVEVLKSINIWMKQCPSIKSYRSSSSNF